MVAPFSNGLSDFPIKKLDRDFALADLCANFRVNICCPAPIVTYMSTATYCKLYCYTKSR